MSWEEVGVGGVIGVVGTLLGAWIAYSLERRTTKRARIEREARLRALLAGEIMTNTGQIIVGDKTSGVKAAGIGSGGPKKPHMSRAVFDGMKGDLTLLPPDVVTSILRCYQGFEIYSDTVQQFRDTVDGHPLKEKFAAVAWEQRDSTRDTALATLNKLGASSEIAYLSKIKPVLDEAAAGLSEKLSNANVTKPGP